MDLERLKKQAESGDLIALLTLIREAKRRNDEELEAWASECGQRLLNALEQDAALLRVALGIPEPLAVPVAPLTPTRRNPFEELMPNPADIDPNRWPKWLPQTTLERYPNYWTHTSSDTAGSITFDHGDTSAGSVFNLGGE